MSLPLSPRSVPRLESVPAPGIGGLSEREREVLELIAEGRSNLGIALSLFITERTVETHIRSILLKVNVPDTPGVHRRVFVARAYLDRPVGHRLPAPTVR